ncbi:MAG: zinc ABC transporter substrate-binding protein [Acidobacteriota bacterium]|jgi:zinc/manganese transport system substrate-binding protein
MKRIMISILLLSISLPLYAEELHVATTYPYIASIVRQVGGDRVDVHALADGDWDPHVIVPKPSYIAKLRAADLIIMSGAQLEIGWLPPLMNQANNPKINVGSRGLLNLSRSVPLIDVPAGVSRAQGDIHPEGNPHFYLDPHNIPLLSKSIADRLAELDSAGESEYQNKNRTFTERWNGKLAEWDGKLEKVKGITVIEYHKLYDYFLRRYDLKLLGTVETLPGIPPTSKHIESLEKMIASSSVSFILQDVYHPDDASKLLAKKYGISIVKIPHDVGAVAEAKDIFTLFDEIIRRLTDE